MVLMDGPMLSSRDEYINIQVDMAFRQWLAKAALFGALLILLSSGVELLVRSELFVRSFFLKLCIAVFLFSGYLMVRKELLGRYAALLAVLWVTIITLFLEFTILIQAGSEVRYVISNIVLSIVVIGFIPARFMYVVVMALIMFGSFLLPLVTGAFKLIYFDLSLVIFYLLMTHVSLLLMRFISEKSVIHELGMKYDLDQYRSGLEKEVVARTGELALTVESLQREIGQRKKAEDEQQAIHKQFLQAQKLESVGRLAGGVAHDINNILSIIISANGIAQLKLPSEHPAQEYLTMVHSAGNRAASVTRQLLAFSRKQVLELKVVDLNAVVGGIMKMLVRMIGEDVRMEFRPAGALRSVAADVSQLEQVLMNLAVNARDAMPGGGNVVIETANEDKPLLLAEDAASPSEGPYVRLSFIDSGCGMTEEVKQHIFEPFYTTKDPGKGTGLGLATVYGIVKQHKGHVLVYSAPGAGTVFHVYLPAAAEGAVETSSGENRSMPRGKETILLVEDDAMICQLTAELLSSLGYSVTAAFSGEEALQKFSTHEGSIDLLLADVVMPGMSGKMVADAICKTCPSIKVIFISGYTADKLTDHGVHGPSITLIEKPIMLEKLAITVRNVLDGRDIHEQKG